MDWILPPGFSTYAADIDRIYYAILIITGIAFVVVEVALVWFLFKYRAKPGRKAHYVQGSVKAEVIWTAVPAVVVVAIGVWSGDVWGRIRGRDSVPANAVPIQVMAKQFEWNATYPGPDAQLGTADDFTIRNQVHVPLDRPTVIELEAEEVIHSFFIPAFRVKQDAVPGMRIRVWFQPTQAGEYELACAELCGLQHYRMRGRIFVHSAEDYQRWLAEQTPRPAAQE